MDFFPQDAKLSSVFSETQYVWTFGEFFVLRKSTFICCAFSSNQNYIVEILFTLPPHPSVLENLLIQQHPTARGA